MNRDGRRAQKRRQKRKDEKRALTGAALAAGGMTPEQVRRMVPRTGPGLEFGDIADAVVVAKVDRRHVPGCVCDDYGLDPGCESDVELRARLVERFG